MIKNPYLNEKQKEFVYANGKNVLVSASAGSGKTTTMIEKLVALMLIDKIKITDILVVTFTDASAGEMKQKLFNTLVKYSKVIQNEMAGETDQQKILEHNNTINIINSNLEELSYSDIGTFHAVFKKIITQYFYEVDIDPDFKIVSNEEQDIMLMTSITNVISKFVQSDDIDFYNLQETFNQKRNDTAFRDVVTSLYYTCKEKPDYNTWFDDMLKNNYNSDLNSTKSAKYLFEHTKSKLMSYENKLNFYLNKINEYEWSDVFKYFEVFKVLLQDLKNAKTFKDITNILFAFELEARLNFVKERDEDADILVENLKAFRDAFKASIEKSQQDLITSNFDELIKSNEYTKNLIVKLNSVVIEVDKEYTKQKNKKSMLDFNDLQIKMLQLCNNKNVLEEIRNKYKFIFIDEFQDVNEIQYKIAKMISRNNNLNMIGDVKQSIYEFRLASPKIFIDLYNDFKKNTDFNQVIDLNENYRSSKNILLNVNTVFNELITESSVGIDYKNTSQLIAGNEELIEFDKKLISGGKNNVKLMIIDNNKSGSEEQENEYSADEITPSFLEVETIVEAVNELKGKPYFNTDTKQIEFIDYKDIAILVRSNSTFANQLYLSMSKYKIPCTANSKESIFKTNEVKVVMSLLGVIDNQIDDYNITTLLHSPFFNFSYNDLAKIRLKTNDKMKSFYECIINYINFDFNEKANQNISGVAQGLGENSIKVAIDNDVDSIDKDNEIDSDIKDRLNSFFKEINHLRYVLNNNKLYDTISDYLSEKNIYNLYLAYKNGRRILDNIEEFLSLLNTQSFDYNLQGCLNYLKILNDSDNLNIAYSSGDNAVKIMTMHKSKGLEYPAVILAGLGNSFNKSSLRAELSISNNLGMGIKSKNVVTRNEVATLTYNATKIEKVNSEQKEQIRLLYVAMTRAKNYLYMVGKYKLNNINLLEYKNVLSIDNHMEMILKSITSVDSCISKYLDDSNNNKSSITNENKSTFEIKIIDKFNKVFDTDKEVEFIEKFDVSESLIARMKKVNDFNYLKKSNIAIKNSVSSILKEEDYVNHNPQPISFKTNENIASELAKDYGIFVHAIMKEIDYNNGDFNIAHIVDKVAKTNVEFSKLLKMVDINSIKIAVDEIRKLIDKNDVVLKEKQFILQDNYNNILLNSDIDEKVIVQGVVDLIIIKGKKGVVVDFKTNKNTSAEKLINLYKLQLDIYAKAVHDGLKVEVSDKYIYSFDLNTLIKVD